MYYVIVLSDAVFTLTLPEVQHVHHNYETNNFYNNVSSRGTLHEISILFIYFFLIYILLHLSFCFQRLFDDWLILLSQIYGYL